ncbi:organomercurial lyase [Kaarinaea lacus]
MLATENALHTLELLRTHLPLKARQQNLAAEVKQLHQYILSTLVRYAESPCVEKMQEILSEVSVTTALQQLERADLVVLGDEQNVVLGAYPFTLEPRRHQVHVNNHSLFAMCALDAVSIAPMFDTEVSIASRCQVSEKVISIRMKGKKMLSASAAADIYVGIQWQLPDGHAANSLCLNMVFLHGEDATDQWRLNENANSSILTLAEAVGVGNAFFKPLLN